MKLKWILLSMAGRASFLSGLLILAAFTSAAFTLAACGPKVAGFQNPSNRAENAIGSSFQIQTVRQLPIVGEIKADHAKISIQKSALEKEFLLQSSLITQELAPQFHGQQSRVVFFRLEDKKVYLVEASKGLLIARDYLQVLPLAEFPVLEETDSSITFDFNAGMSRLFSASDWQTRDAASLPSYRSIKVVFSYISSATVGNENAVEIHQTALLETPNGSSLINRPIEVVYYLTPYAPNPDFVPTVAPRTLDRMGFFEARSQYNNDGGSVSFASKRDISKPIVFAISANTPARYHDAVRDGILYWNKAFGKTVIQVIEGTPEEVAPNPLHNIVQWVDWDSAGFAYADAQMDPRTGEILHQQIYFTSAWARIGRSEIQKFTRTGTDQVGLTGFGSSVLCEMNLNSSIADDLSHLTGNVASEKILKASQDLIREVVAHEIGHTLGLRHNFAGSLAANYALESRDALFKTYLDTGVADPNLITSSSVMDYQFPLESMMNGDQIAKISGAAEYDEKAIQSLYFGKKYKESELPLFCTDSHVGRYADCKPYDAGSSYIGWVKYNAHHALETLPNRVIQTFIASKAPSFGQVPIDVREVSIDPKLASILALESEDDLVSLLRKDQHLLSVDRKFGYVNAANNEEIRQKLMDLFNADLARNGSWDAVMAPTSSATTSHLYEKFAGLLQDPQIIRGTNADGKPYEFTAQELSDMQDMGKAFFARLRLELAKTELLTLNGESPMASLLEEMVGPGAAPAKAASSPFAANDVSDGFANYLANRSEQFITETSGAPSIYKRNTASEWSLPNGSAAEPAIGGSKPEVTTLTLPNFAYPFELRKMAAGLLRSGRGENPGWGYGNRLALQKVHDKLLNDALPGVTVRDSGNIENYPRAVVRWILEAREIRQALGTSTPSIVLTPTPNL